jgi:hypothetical protein
MARFSGRRRLLQFVVIALAFLASLPRYALPSSSPTPTTPKGDWGAPLRRRRPARFVLRQPLTVVLVTSLEQRFTKTSRKSAGRPD